MKKLYTQDEYLGVLRHFLKYYENCPLDTMGEIEIRKFLLYLIDSEKSSGTVNIHNSALRFIYGAVLERNVNTRMIPRQRDYREFPKIMHKDEIQKFFDVIDNLRDRAMFETIYGSGLRISEIVKLRVQDIAVGFLTATIILYSSINKPVFYFFFYFFVIAKFSVSNFKSRKQFRIRHCIFNLSEIITAGASAGTEWNNFFFF